MHMKTFMRGSSLLAAGLLLQTTVQAMIVGPYSPDPYTLHSWHFDETNAPLVSAYGGTNLVVGGGAIIGVDSFTGFDKALSTFDGGPSLIANTNKDAYAAIRPLANSSADNANIRFSDPVTGAFTIEAIVRIDFDPTPNYGTTANGGNGRNAQCLIVSAEDEANPGRLFQFRLAPIGTLTLTDVNLEFINVNQAVAVQSVAAPIPLDGPNAIVSNRWYHVAVTYNGNQSEADNLKLYWTPLEASRTEANLLGSFSLTADVPAASTDFAIGNSGRNTSTANFLGLIDEVRISSIARAANAMQFVSPNVTIIQAPAAQTVGVGQEASFTVLASGEQPIGYQWRLNNTPITGATQSVYSITSARAIDAGNYDVVITNPVSTATTTPVALTVRTPRNLTWNGQYSIWDTASPAWNDSVSGPNAIFSQGDNARFDDSLIPWGGMVNLVGVLTPSSVVVDSAADYTFIADSGGTLANNSSLTKRGAGMLKVDVDLAFNGPTVVQSGTLAVGDGSNRGSLGSGNITNNGTLLFARGGTLTIPTTLYSSGAIISSNTGNIRLVGTNAFTAAASVVHDRGTLTFGPSAIDGLTRLTVNPYGGGNGTTLALVDGVTVPTTLATTLASTNDAQLGAYTNNWRSTVLAESGTNTWNGPIGIEGNNAIFANANAGAMFVINGPVSGNEFSYQFALRGAGNGHLFSPVYLPKGALAKTDGGTWTVHSAGTNTYLYTLIVGGTLALGNDNALATNGFIQLGNGTLDLAGYNQSTTGLSNDASGVRTIVNSSTERDSLLTIATAKPWVFDGRIIDFGSSTGRTAGIKLTGGGSLSLSNATHTYTGPTIIESGTLALTGAGQIPTSGRIELKAGATLNASTRTDATLAISANQTLKGTGTFTVLGNVTSAGTIEMDVAKAATVTSSRLTGATQITYGGTLQLNLSGDALTATDAIKLFDATSYAGAFDSILPTSPSSSLSWDTSTLAIDGTLRVKTGGVQTPTSLTFAVTPNATALDISWPANYTGWTLQAQTNAISTGLSSNWQTVPGSAGTNRMVLPIDKAAGAVFYRLVP